MKKSEKNKTLETDGKPTLYWNQERLLTSQGKFSIAQDKEVVKRLK